MAAVTRRSRCLSPMRQRLLARVAPNQSYGSMLDPISRRDFLKRSSVVTAGLATLGSGASLRAAKSPNEKVVIAIVGCNARGMAHIAGYLPLPNAEIGYICDVDSRAVEKGIAAVARKQQIGRAS